VDETGETVAVATILNTIKKLDQNQYLSKFDQPPKPWHTLPTAS